MVTFTDIGVAIILLAAFAKGFSRGFLGTTLKFIVLGLAAYVALYHTQQFSSWFTKVSFIKEHPAVAMLIVFLVSMFVLNIGKYAIQALFGNTVVFNNIFLRFIAGLFGAGIAALVITAIILLLQGNNINPQDWLPNYDNSYTKEMVNYINNGLNVTDNLKEITHTFKNTASNLKLN